MVRVPMDQKAVQQDARDDIHERFFRMGQVFDISLVEGDQGLFIDMLNIDAGLWAEPSTATFDLGQGDDILYFYWDLI